VGDLAHQCACEGSALKALAPIRQGLSLAESRVFLTGHGGADLCVRRALVQDRSNVEVAQVNSNATKEGGKWVRVVDRFAGNRHAFCKLEQHMTQAGLLDYRLDGVLDRELGLNTASARQAQAGSTAPVRAFDVVVGGPAEVSLRDLGAARDPDEDLSTSLLPPLAAPRLADAEAANKRPRANAPPPGALDVAPGDCMYVLIICDCWRTDEIRAPEDQPVRDWLRRTPRDAAFTPDERRTYLERREALLAEGGDDGREAEGGLTLANFRLTESCSSELYGLRQSGRAAPIEGRLRSCRAFSERVVAAHVLGRVMAVDTFLRRALVRVDCDMRTGNQLARRYDPSPTASRVCQPPSSV